MSNNSSVDDDSDMNIDERTRPASIPQSFCKEPLINQNSHESPIPCPYKSNFILPGDELLDKERPFSPVQVDVQEDQIPSERLASSSPVKNPKYRNPLSKEIPDHSNRFHSKSSNSSLYLRLQEYSAKSELKVINAANQQMQKKLKECTFKPKTNSNTPTRSFETFLQLQQSHLDRINAKAHFQKNNPDKSIRRPKLCKNSYKILKKRQSMENNQEVSPKPIKKSVSAELTPVASPSPTHKHNNKILKGKLKSELDKVYQELSSQEGLRYSLYIILLKRMNFVKNEFDKMLALDSWELLSKGSEYINKQKILSFLLSVMNITHSREIHLKYISFYQNRSIKVQHPPCFSTKSRSPSQERLEFLTNERQNNLQKWKKMKIAQEKKEISDFSFRPRINKANNREKKKESIKSMWRQLGKGRRSTQKAISLFSLSAAMQANAKQRIEDAKNFKFHDDMRQCSFSPIIRKHYLMGKTPKTQAKGVHEAVNRIRNARNDTTNTPTNRTFNCGIERKSKRVNDFKHLAAVNSPKCSFRVSNVCSSDSDSDSCIQEISIMLPDGTVDKIYISNEDDKSIAVDSFIKKHSLQPDLSEQLRREIMNN